MPTGNLRRVALIVGSLLSVGLGGCNLADFTLGAIDLERYDAQETLTQEIPYGGERIAISVALGKVVVRGREEPGYVAWRPLLGIEAAKKIRGLKLEDVTLEITREEGTISIRSDLVAERIGRRLKALPPGVEERVGWVELTLFVPPGAPLVIDVGAGTVDVVGLRSERLEVRSGLGSIALRDSLITQVVLASEMGDVTVETTSGVELRASTQMGSVRVRNSRWESVQLESDLGDVVLEGTRTGGGWARTDMGSIRAALFGDEPLRVRAATRMGRIRLRGAERVLPAEAVRWGAAWPGQTLTLQLGPGAAPDPPDPEDEGGTRRIRTLQLSTELGNIEIVLLPPARP